MDVEPETPSLWDRLAAVVVLPLRGLRGLVGDVADVLFPPERAQRVVRFADDHGLKVIAVFALVFAVLPLLPFQLRVFNVPLTGFEPGFAMSVYTELFMFAVLALSWDLIGGQTGYPSFGQMAFFGIGAYTTALLVKKAGVAFPPAFLLAGVLALVAAAVIGAIVLRLRGGYFAIATLGVLLVAQQVTRILEFTNGSDGVILFDTPDIIPVLALPTGTEFYYLFLALLVTEMVLVRYLAGTRFGFVLNAIRDDEAKATAMGVNTTVYKTAAWMVAALFTGFAGGAYGLFNTFVNPATGYNLAWNVELIAMSLLGGAGTVAGPIIGAFGLHTAVVILDAVATGYQLILTGLVVIVVVVAFPRGLVGSIAERASAIEYFRYGGQAAGESAGGAEGDEPEPTSGGERA